MHPHRNRAQRARQLSMEILEHRRLLVGNFTQAAAFPTWPTIPSSDISGITYQPSSDRLFMVDSEIDELPQYNGNNTFETTLAGPLTAQYPLNNDEPTGITFNEGTDTSTLLMTA